MPGLGQYHVLRTSRCNRLITGSRFGLQDLLSSSLQLSDRIAHFVQATVYARKNLFTNVKKISSSFA